MSICEWCDVINFLTRSRIRAREENLQIQTINEFVAISQTISGIKMKMFTTFSSGQELSMKDTAYHMMRSRPGLSHSRFYRPFVLIVVVLLHNYWKTDMVNNYVSDVEFRDSSLVVSVCTFILFYLIFKIQRSDDDDDW